MGTDVALMLGIAHTLVENGWHDEAFLARCTTGYEVFSDYLLGVSDGIAKTAEWADPICGVPAAKIRELAELFHKNTTMLMAGWGMQRQQFGEQKHWMIVTLSAMLGQPGIPGGGFGLSYHFANGGIRPAVLPCWRQCRAACKAGPTRWRKSRWRALWKRWKTPARRISITG